ncbi:MBL fold metallo-hydrolase [Robiginitomaculum antarcticum]|uniref:MBL fold metallo-hydrolase n=1 Tax=Robiginitomaculum antarcticum TaxID=437507 RepID=UPI000372364B|nr:MBL fold metallo-hydrolase [Robiginitomaculum antarcticum]
MSYIKTTASALALLSLAGFPAMAHGPESDSEKTVEEAAPEYSIETTDLGGGIYMLVGRGGNIGVSFGEDGLIMIDDQYDYMSPAIKTALSAISDEPVRLLINTHFHGDHTGGNAVFMETGATIVAHHNVHKRLTETTKSDLFDRESGARPDAAPHLTYGSDMTFHLNGQSARLIYAPGHTDGDTIVYFQDANVMHLGDNYFNGMFPYVDTGAGGNIDGMIEAQHKALDMADDETQIIPGHGPLATKADLQASYAMLVDIRSKVIIAMDGGKTVDEVVAMDPLVGMEAYNSFIDKDNMVRATYFSLD